jgi:nucleotide-binding universal stress UspA family protein
MKVIAVLDASAATAAVMAGARALADRLDAPLEALHVRPHGAAGVPDMIVAAAADHHAELTVVEGGVIDELTDLVTHDDCVVMIGARADVHGPLPAGSTARAVACAATCPVVVTPPTATLDDVQRVLLPLEGTQDAAVARGVLSRLIAHGVEILPLHVFVPSTVPAFWDQPHHAAPAWSEDFLARFGPQEGGELWLRSGDVADAVLEVAQRTAADLVALTWSRDLSSHHAPVVRSLLARSPVPVMLIPVDADVG